MNEQQRQRLEKLRKEYYAKRQMAAEDYHEDEEGVWVRATTASGERADVDHLIRPDGEAENVEPRRFRP